MLYYGANDRSVSAKKTQMEEDIVATVKAYWRCLVLFRVNFYCHKHLNSNADFYGS